MARVFGLSSSFVRQFFEEFAMYCRKQRCGKQRFGQFRSFVSLILFAFFAAFSTCPAFSQETDGADHSNRAADTVVASVPKSGEGSVAGDVDGKTVGTVVREQTIYVPYEKIRQVFEQPGRGVYIPYEEFQALRDAAKPPKEIAKLPESPIAAMISEMESVATVSGNIVTVDAKITIEVFRDGWIEIPLQLEDAALLSATMEGQPAKMLKKLGEGYQLLIDNTLDNLKTQDIKAEARSRRLELLLSYAQAIEKSPGKNSVTFNIPQASISRWKVVVPEPDAKIDFSPMIAAPESDANTEETASNATNETVLHALVGAAPQVRFSWTSKAEGATGLEALTNVQILQQTTVEEDILRTTARLEYEMSRGTVETLAVAVPENQTVVSAFDPNIRKWSVRHEGGKQIVDIELFEPASTRQTVQMELEQLLTTPKDAKDAENVKDAKHVLAIPELTAWNVDRQQGILAVKTADEIALETVRTQGLLRMDTAELPGSLGNQKWEAAYRIAGTSYALEVALSKIEPRITAMSQMHLGFEADATGMEWLVLFNIEQAGIFQMTFEIPAEAQWVEVNGNMRNAFQGGYTAAIIDDFTLADSKDNPGMKTMTVNLRRKAIGKVGLMITYSHRHSINMRESLRETTEKTEEIAIKLPGLGKNFVERTEGRMVLHASDTFRVNALELQRLQAVSVEQVQGDDWYHYKGGRLAFLFGDTLPSFKIQAERRKPQFTLHEVRTVRIDDGSIKQTAKFLYDVRFSGIKSFRIDVPEALSGRINLKSDGDWRETRIIPAPEDVAPGYVAWEFATKSSILGSGQFEISWEDELSQLEIGKSLPISIPRFLPQKQQPADRIWGQILLAKSQSVNLGESEETKGLIPIDPQQDIDGQYRIADAVAAYEYHDHWNFQLIATRYKIEDVKKTSIEQGVVRANLFETKKGIGISAQALFRVRSVQQRLELAMPEKAEISEIKINDRSIALESDTDSSGKPRFMIPLTSIPPDTLFTLDVRYTIEPPCHNRIEIPYFPGSGDGDDVSTPAIQKIDLYVYVPNRKLLTGFRGNWAREFSHFSIHQGQILPMNENPSRS